MSLFYEILQDVIIPSAALTVGDIYSSPTFPSSLCTSREKELGGEIYASELSLDILLARVRVRVSAG